MADFKDSLNAKLSKRGIKMTDFFNANSPVEGRVIKEYGAVFLNNDVNALMPRRCLFASSSEVDAFQSRVKTETKTLNKKTIKLQKAAMDALLLAEAKGGKITPKGDNPAKRSYDTVSQSWNEAVIAGANYWKTMPNGKGEKLSTDESAKLKTLSGEAQITKVFELESRGFHFHPDHQRSIVVYTAIPGASQHLLMLAVDIVEYTDKNVRSALAENGWFQTVFRDRPHFTYLGLKQTELQSFGLKLEQFEGRDFWIPNI